MFEGWVVAGCRVGAFVGVALDDGVEVELGDMVEEGDVEDFGGKPSSYVSEGGVRVRIWP